MLQCTRCLFGPALTKSRTPPSQICTHATTVHTTSNFILSRCIPTDRCTPINGRAMRSRAEVLTMATNEKGSGSVPSPQSPETPPDPDPSTGPTFMDGINWYCYVVLGLIFITDFTPIGPLIRYSGSAGSSSPVAAALWLAAVQWVGFVLPTLKYMRDKDWDLRGALRINAASPIVCVGAAAAGAVLWAAIAAALAAKSGVSLLDLPGSAPGMDQTTLGGIVQRPRDAAEWAQLVVATAASPAVGRILYRAYATHMPVVVAEELLFRGFLLTALQQRLGNMDAVFLCGALFSAGHLDPQQFFGLTVMGIAAGGAVLVSGSVLPAVALHLGYNLSALAAGVLITG